MAEQQKPVLHDALMLVGYSNRTTIPRAERAAYKDGVKHALAELQNRGGYQPLMPLFPIGTQVRLNWVEQAALCAHTHPWSHLYSTRGLHLSCWHTQHSHAARPERLACSGRTDRRARQASAPQPRQPP